MIPALFETEYALLRTRVEKVVEFTEKRLRADLSDLHVISIDGRAKEATSAHQKLHTGKYASLTDLTDLAGVTVVLLHRRDVLTALEAAKGAGFQLVEEPSRDTEPALFRYREPKLILAPPADYLERNADLEGIVCEVQFTSALQNALDILTHDFDYKGKTYSWSNFRLVAQLRGMLELVDQMIDDIERVTLPGDDAGSVPSDFAFSASMLPILQGRFDAGVLPKDQRRLADTVAKWAAAVGLDSIGIDSLLERHVDLVSARSLDPTSATLGALLREHGTQLLETYPHRFVVSSELETLCAEAALVPEERRVRFVDIGEEE